MTSAEIQKTFDLAYQHQQAGRLHEAAKSYRDVLLQQPQHAEATHFLGVVAHQTGQNESAVELIRRAIALRPDYAEAHSNLGNVLKALGKIDDAIDAYRQAVACNPALQDAYNNLANALSSKGQMDQAIVLYRQAIALKPDYGEALSNLGAALRDKGLIDDAIDSCKQSVASTSPVDSARSSPPFFIVGYERSGTTLMAAILDRHSRVAVPPETHFFFKICPIFKAGQTADPATLADRFISGERTRDLKLDRDELLRRLEAVKPSWVNLFLTALRLYADNHGKQIIGEKTPPNWQIVPAILKLLPDSRVIWVVRDGRDTIASLMKTPWKSHSNWSIHAWKWRRSMEFMLKLEQYNPTRITRIQFENLVARPEPEITRICDFLEIAFERRQLDPNVPTDVVPQWEMQWKDRALAALDPSRVGVAERELSREQLEHLNSIMSPTMRKIGYGV